MIVPDSIEFYIIFFSACVVIAIKLAIVIILAIKIHGETKEGIPAGLRVPFMRGLMVMILFLFVSRLSFMIFDFYYTKFDMDLYYLQPNVWFWQLGNLLATTGMAAVIFVTERTILHFKTKGIITYMIIACGIFTMVFPVRSRDDFNFLSTILIFPAMGILITFLSFLNMAIKTKGHARRNATTMSIAIMLYAAAALLVNAGLITAFNSALGFDVDVYFYLLQAIFKVAGIVLIAYGASRWVTTIEYYGSKRMCIVHRGIIKGQVFMCTKCNAFYCVPCKEAIAGAENKCWNCGALLDESLRVKIFLRAGEPLFDRFQDIKTRLKLDDVVKTFEEMIVLSNQALDNKEGKGGQVIQETARAEPVADDKKVMKGKYI